MLVIERGCLLTKSSGSRRGHVTVISHLGLVGVAAASESKQEAASSLFSQGSRRVHRVRMKRKRVMSERPDPVAKPSHSNV